MTVIKPPSFSRFRLLSHVHKLGQYRDLLLTLSIHRIKVRYKQSLLGISWAILQPLSMMLIFTFIFSKLAGMPSEGSPYAVFAYTALLPWTFFSTAIATGTNAMVSHSELIRKVYFPREILPFTYIIASLFDFALASTVLAGLIVYYRVPVTLEVLYVIPIIIVLTMFSTAMALLFSAVQVRFRDVGVAMPLLLQLWMFVTPVVYPLNRVPARYYELYSLNPMVGLIENFRRAILAGAPPDLYSLAVSAAVTALLLPASYMFFKHVEATTADII